MDETIGLIMNKKYFIVILLLFTIVFSIFSSELKYGLINGNNVNIRLEANIKSSVITKLIVGELVTVIEKSNELYRIGKDEYNWFKIKTKKGITGWIYGKYLTLIKEKPKSYSFYKKIIWNNLKKEAGRDSLSNVKIKFDKGRGLIYCSFIITDYCGDKCDGAGAIGLNYILKIDGDHLNLIFVTSSNNEIILYKDYIINKFSNYRLEVYDTSQNRKKDIRDLWSKRLQGIKKSNDSVCKLTYSFSIRKYEKENSLKFGSGSFIRFDKSNMLFTLFVKKNKNSSIIKSIIYKFNNGKFLEEE